MPLEAPTLDNRTFKELVAEARKRLTRYSGGQWTDLNDSDPGMAIVQLFAWLTEMTLYQMNRVPERNYIKFLQLLGMERRPAKPATAHVTFTMNPKAGEYPPARAGIRVAGQDPESGEQLVFETTRDLDLFGFNIEAVQVNDGVTLDPRTNENAESGALYTYPLGTTPQRNNALYLGFGPVEVEDDKDPPRGDFPAIHLRIFGPDEPEQADPQVAGPSESRFYGWRPPSVLSDTHRLLKRVTEQGADIDTWKQDGEALVARLAAVLAAPDGGSSDAPRLQWEYQPQDDPDQWRRLSVLEDETDSLKKAGYVRLDGARDFAARQLGAEEDAEFFYWIRARLVSGAYPAGTIPHIDFVRAHTVDAENLTTRENEILGVSDGSAGQTFAFKTSRRPVRALELETVDDDGLRTDWEETEDLQRADADDLHYHLNATAGVVRFGDGTHGRIPVAGRRIIARTFRYGGGDAGNLEAGKIDTLLQNILGVDGVTNERAATGGKDEQSVDELKREAPGMIRRNGRAVTEQDFRSLALEGGEVLNATAIALAHPDHPGVPVPGAVTVVVVPDSQDIPPRPTKALLESVRDYIDARRLITTEVHVTSPRFYSVRVIANVTAERYASFGDLRAAVRKKLTRFLSPIPWTKDADELAGPDVEGETRDRDERGGDGWQFGRDLHPTQLYGVIQEVDTVVAVNELHVFVNNVEIPEDRLKEAFAIPPDGLVYGVSEEKHEIIVEPETDL